MYGYIYLTTNLITHKIYIGQKKSDKFLGNKYLGSGKYLLESVKTHGRENFTVELLCECDSAEELNDKEIEYIEKYNSTDLSIGYNISHGGAVPTGLVAWNKGLIGCYTKSEESKKKLSNTLTGHITTDKTRLKISEANSGKKRTPEQNKANSLRNKNKIWITNGTVQKTISKDDEIPEGWYRGRLKSTKPAWNKGLNKDTDERVKAYSDARKQRLASGERIGWANCPHNQFGKGQSVKEYLDNID